ncbi:MAG: ABC transporter substrate-binding protein, partial [Bacillota bacterium]
MPHNARSFIVVVAMVVLALVASGCGSDTAASGRGGVLVVGNSADVDSLDPHLAADLYTARICDQIFDTLVRLDYDGRYVGSLAESWEVEEEGRIWKFRLRDDVICHDGETLDPEDVVFSFERILDPETESPRRDELSLVEEVKVNSEDDHTLTVVLSEPNGAFLSLLLNVYVVPEHLVSELDGGAAGTGPFVLEEWVTEERIELSAFEDYWAGSPLLDGLVFRPIPEVSTRVVELETGGIHLMDEVPGEDLERLEEDEEVELTTAIGSNYSVLGLNMDREPFDDPMVRRAIAHAVDRKRLVDTVYPGTAVVAEGPLPPSSWAHDPEFSGPDFDLERAREYMENSRVPDGFSTEMLISEGDRMERGAVLLQSMLAEIGIDVEITSLEWGTFLGQLISRDYDMLRVAWTTDPEPDALLYSLLHSDSEMLNFTGFDDSGVDDLLDEGRRETDVDR